MMTVEQIAGRLAVSENTIHRLIHEGKISAIKVGRQFRIEKEEFERFMASVQVSKQGAA